RSGLLIPPGGGHHVRRLVRPVVGLDEEPRRARLATHRAHRHAGPERRLDEGAVVVEEAHHLVAGSEAVGIAPTIRVPGQRDAPGGELEGEGVPPLAAPALGHPAALENDVLAAQRAQVIAQRQPGLAAAHDHRLDRLAHAGMVARIASAARERRTMVGPCPPTRGGLPPASSSASSCWRRYPPGPRVSRCPSMRATASSSRSTWPR